MDIAPSSKTKKRIQEKVLIERRNRLYEQVKERPSSRKALIELYSTLYDLREYATAAEIAKKASETGEFSGEIYVHLARCLFRKWVHSQNLEDLLAVFSAYQSAMADKLINQRALAYLELVSICVRLGKYQEALDALGAFLLLFKTFKDFVLIGHYNIALIMALSGNYAESLKIYQDLVLHPFTVSLDFGENEDHIVFIPVNMSEPVLNFEIAALLMKMGKQSQATLLLKESHMRILKYKYTGWNKENFDNIMREAVFEKWFTNSQTFKLLGDFFKQNHNLFMASEMYSMASMKIAGRLSWAELDQDSKDILLGLYMDGAECLAAVRCFKQAEVYAHRAFSLAANDMIIVDRAAKCCRENVKENEVIFNASKVIWKACRRVQDILRGKILKRRLIADRKRELAATKICSFIRMALTRNRTAGDRLSEVTIRRIQKLVASLNKVVLKSGKDQIAMWMELWFTSATQIQSMLRKWYVRRKYTKFRKGLGVMKKVFRGQIRRKRLREQVARLQKELDDPSFSDVRREELLKEFETEKWSFYVNIYTINRLCSGNTCVSSEENFIGAVSLSDPSSPLRPRSRKERRDMQKDGSLVIKPRDVSHRSSARSLSPETTKKSRWDINNDKADLRKPVSKKSSLVFSPGKKEVLQQDSSLIMANEDKTQGASIVVGADSNYIGEDKTSFIRDSPDKSPNNRSDRVDLTKTPSKFKSANMNINITFTNSKSQFDSTVLCDKNSTFEKSATSEIQLQSTVNNHAKIEDFVRDPSEDIISFISLISLRKDPSKLWVPFGIIPDVEISRLLKCTILVITSPSFSMQDSRRLSYCAASNIDNWVLLRSIIIFGTRMGDSGLTMIFSLGISQLQSLTIGNTNMSYHILTLIGEQLMQKTLDLESIPVSMSGSCVNLTKIYLESEHQIGDRGVVQLMKCLQRNTTVKIVSIRDCKITGRGAKACARYISQSYRLESMNLSDNLLDEEACISLIRAVANRGAKGYFKSLFLKSQNPIFSVKQLLELYQNTVALNVGFSAENLDAVDETKAELIFNKGSDKDDAARMHRAFEDMVKQNKILEAGEIAYKKTVYF